MERHLDEELNKVKSLILRMAAMVETAIQQSIDSLKVQNKNLAEIIIKNDQNIDEMEIKIEEEIMAILALYQPLAIDLRFIITGMHINAELERIADLTVNISQRVLDIEGEPLLKPLIDIPKLADQAKFMVKNAIDAFVSKDGNLAKEVILSDKEANNLRTLIIKELIDDYMMKDGNTVKRAVDLLLITRDLERICDHASAISEDIIYMIQAKIVKHHRERLLE